MLPSGPALARSLLFAAAFVGAGYLGRQTIPEGATFSLIWPAAGVGVLWFLVQGSRMRSLDTLLLAAVAFGANRATGAPADISAVLMVSNVSQTLLTVHLLRRWCPDLWGAGGERTLDSPWLAARYLLTLSGGVAGGMLLGMAGAGVVTGDLSLAQGVLWFDRNLCGALAVTTVGLLCWHRLAQPRPRPPLLPDRESRIELGGATVFTVLSYGVAFSLDGLPIAFLLMVATVWVGVRFPSLVSVLHSLVVGTFTIVLTLIGSGPFADLATEQTGTLLAQFFLVMLLVSGLVLSTGRDERQQLTQELRESRAEAIYQADLLAAMVNSVVEGMAVVDETGDLLLLNPAALEVLGAASHAAAPKSLAEIELRHVDGSALAETDRPAYRALRGESVSNASFRVGKPGRERILSISASPLPRDLEGGGARAVILARDATNEHAQRAELAAFAGVVAHDLRNPLAAIKGWIELLEDEAEEGELHPEMVGEFVDRVRSSTERMIGLVVHLLGHATSQHGELEPTELDLCELVRRIAAARGAADVVFCRQIPRVVADAVLIEQLLDNLIGNALKYVARGVRPDVIVSGRHGPDGLVTVLVEDNGIGLPPGEHESVFEEFHRAHGGDDYEGTGLGLAISRRIVLRHGGTITARVREEGGSAFEFTLPGVA